MFFIKLADFCGYLFAILPAKYASFGAEKLVP